MTGLKFVYYNLHKHCWSVRDECLRKVERHTDVVVLRDVQFKVGKAGRERVFRERRKNVHAGVRGYETDGHPFIITAKRELVEVGYNPYRADYFYRKDNGSRVDRAALVVLQDKRVFAKAPYSLL